MHEVIQRNGTHPGERQTWWPSTSGRQSTERCGWVVGGWALRGSRYYTDFYLNRYFSSCILKTLLATCGLKIDVASFFCLRRKIPIGEGGLEWVYGAV